MGLKEVPNLAGQIPLDFKTQEESSLAGCSALQALWNQGGRDSLAPWTYAS